MVIGGKTHQILCAVAAVNLDDQGRRLLPPITSSFLGFGFVPVTATLQIVQDGPDPLTVVLYNDEGPRGIGLSPARPWTAVVTGRLALQVTSVTVDGARLDVGPSCRTDGDLSTPGNPVAPGEVMMTGGSHLTDPVPYYALFQDGGATSGTVTIPAFTGCVTSSGENLDALLTAAASGPGNYEQIVEGSPCVQLGCRPGNLPEGPPPLFTVTGGGPYHSSGTLTITRGSFSITCDSRISGEFPDMSGPLRNAFASVNWKFSSCAGSDGTTWQVAPDQAGLLSGALYCDSLTLATGNVCPDNSLVGMVDDVSLEFTETGSGASAACTGVQMTGYIVADYTSPNLLTLPPQGATPLGGFTEQHWLLIVSSSCPDLPDVDQSGGGGYGISATYKLQGASPVLAPIFP